MKRFDDFIKEDLEFDVDSEELAKEVEFKKHMENMFKYIKEKCDKGLIEDKHNVEVYGTLDHEDSMFAFSVNIALSLKIKGWNTVEKYLDHIEDAKNEVFSVAKVIKSIGLDPEITDTGDSTRFRVEFQNKYFEEEKVFLAGLDTIKKFDL